MLKVHHQLTKHDSFSVGLLVTVSDADCGLSRVRIRDEARGILAESKKLVVAKGKKLESFEPGGKVDEELVDRMVGSTGNLRAPLVRSGKTTLVGFNEEAWAEALL